MNQLNNIWQPEIVKQWIKKDSKMPTIGADPLNKQPEDILIRPLTDSHLEGWITVTKKANSPQMPRDWTAFPGAQTTVTFFSSSPKKAPKVQGHPTGH